MIRLVLASKRSVVDDPFDPIDERGWWSSIVFAPHADVDLLFAQLGMLIYESEHSFMVDPHDATLFAVDADDVGALYRTLREICT